MSVLATSFVTGMDALASAFAEGRLEPPPPPEALKALPFVGERLFALWTLASANLVSATNQIAPLLGDVASRLLGVAGAVGLLGGTLAHGMIGLFVGPVVLAVGYDLMRVWIAPAQEAPQRAPAEGA